MHLLICEATVTDHQHRDTQGKEANPQYVSLRTTTALACRSTLHTGHAAARTKTHIPLSTLSELPVPPIKDVEYDTVRTKSDKVSYTWSPWLECNCQ